MNSTSPSPSTCAAHQRLGRDGRLQLVAVHAELVGDDVRDRRLADAGRADQQHVVERLARSCAGVDHAAQQPADALLADHLVEAVGAQRVRRARRRRHR
jgi:hypothetical protein